MDGWRGGWIGGYQTSPFSGSSIGRKGKGKGGEAPPSAAARVAPAAMGKKVGSIRTPYCTIHA